MHWILILMIWHTGIGTAVFANEAQCQAAGNSAVLNFEGGRFAKTGDATFICMAYGDLNQ